MQKLVRYMHAHSHWILTGTETPVKTFNSIADSGLVISTPTLGPDICVKSTFVLGSEPFYSL